MPKLHVIYDPTDKLISSHEQLQHLKLKVAVLSVHEDICNGEIAELSRKLSELLLNQLAIPD